MTDKKEAKVTKTLKFEIGGYSNLMQAKREAAEFSLPTVFTRRSGVFPDPTDFGIKVETTKAVAQQWADAPSPLNQFYVDLTVKASGAPAKIDDWNKKVQNTIKVFHASSTRKPGDMGERAAHIRERAAAVKAKK